MFDIRRDKALSWAIRKILSADAHSTGTRLSRSQVRALASELRDVLHETWTTADGRIEAARAIEPTRPRLIDGGESEG